MPTTARMAATTPHIGRRHGAREGDEEHIQQRYEGARSPRARLHRRLFPDDARGFDRYSHEEQPNQGSARPGADDEEFLCPFWDNPDLRLSPGFLRYHGLRTPS
jgi:hypothetical protein